MAGIFIVRKDSLGFEPQTGIAGRLLEWREEYGVYPKGRAEEARLRCWYDEMHAEDLAWRRKVLEERITTFSARVLPGGQVPPWRPPCPWKC